jgi:hypothetical protein
MKYHGKNQKPSQMFSVNLKQIQQGKKSYTDIANSILSLDYTYCKLSAADEIFTRQIARKHLKECKASLYQYTTSKNEILNILRVVFEGKTDTLLSRYHDKYSTLEQPFRDNVKLIRVKHLEALKPIMGKTGGWVTDFLDFTIEELDKSSKSNQEFKKKFSFIFPELSDILRKVSSSIA